MGTPNLPLLRTKPSEIHAPLLSDVTVSPLVTSLHSFLYMIKRYGHFSWSPTDHSSLSHHHQPLDCGGCLPWSHFFPPHCLGLSNTVVRESVTAGSHWSLTQKPINSSQLSMHEHQTSRNELWDSNFTCNPPVCLSQKNTHFLACSCYSTPRRWANLYITHHSFFLEYPHPTPTLISSWFNLSWLLLRCNFLSELSPDNTVFQFNPAFTLKVPTIILHLFFYLKLKHSFKYKNFFLTIFLQIPGNF